MKFAIGDKVKYSAAFLQRIGSEFATMRGIVESTKKNSSGVEFVKVVWDGEPEAKGTCAQYLTKLK